MLNCALAGFGNFSVGEKCRRMLMSGFFSNNSFEHLFMPVSLTLYGPAKINMAAGGEDTRGNMKWYTE